MMYTEEQKRIRDKSVWTVVQAVLAPLQFLIFLISLGLVLYYIGSGEAYMAATVSIVVKTLILYTIMITGAIWEKEIFGQYLFAPAFFWEDVVSMLVLALHTAYLFGLWSGWPQDALITTALLAYTSYVINAGQFLLKLREARRQSASPVPMAAEARP